MAIDFTRYVDIVSGVGAGTVVPTRELIGRIFSINNLIPPATAPLEFTSAAEVGEYFGTTSEEYDRAAFYFSWISKNITRPKKISFSRWVNAAVAPRIYGNVKTQAVGSYTGISAGSFKLTISAVTNSFTGIDLTGAVDLAGVATVIQTKIRTATGGQWTGATVTWNASRGSFDFVGGTTGDTTNVVVEAGASGVSIADLIGWLSGDSLIIANGSAVETITETLTQSAGLSNNFGSFLFQPALTIEQIVEAAIWNNTAPQNVSYQYMVPVVTANITSYYDELSDYGGVGVTLSEIADEYPEMIPMMVLAATDYLALNSVQNYMFQMFAITPGVSTDSVANTLDEKRVNYYGRTQTAGQFLDFYQRGVLMGLDVSPRDMNVYANEQWLKDAAGAAIMTLLLALSRVSANEQGRSQILTTLQSVINLALDNGTISVGKMLTTVQKLYISQVTGDQNAWYQIQTIGYWVNCVIVLEDDEYVAKYVLVYSKDDVIRKVEGEHVLI